MAGWLIAACGVAYLVTAADLALRGQYALAWTFAAYALANAGLWAAAR
jgi:hypothetical protein